MSDLNKLYDPVIRQHNTNPYHFKKIENSSNTVEASNPICGDTFTIYLDLESNCIKSIYFHGYGCAVSMASASVLSKTLEGKSVSQALNLCNIFLGVIQQKSMLNNVPDEFNAFSVVSEFPERYECATLVWTTIMDYLKNLNEHSA